MTNEIAPTQKTGSNIARADGRPQLPIDAHATMYAALTADLNRICKNRQRMIGLKRQIRDKNATIEVRDAALVEFLAARDKLPADIALVESMLNTWATKEQVKVLAGMVAASLVNAGKLETDFWFNAIWMTLTCEDIEDAEVVGGAPVSDTVLALAVLRLCRTTRFRPTPAEFYDAVCSERAKIKRLLDECREDSLRWLATKKPPPVPVFFSEEEIANLEEGYVPYDPMFTTKSLAESDFMGELTTAQRKAAITEKVLRWREDQRERRARRRCKVIDDLSGKEE